MPRVSTPSRTPSAAHTASISHPPGEGADELPGRRPFDRRVFRGGDEHAGDHACDEHGQREEHEHEAERGSFAVNTASRPGPWVKSVFSVSQPYSLPSPTRPT